MGALDLDRLSWPEVEAELEGGRDTVVIALGATRTGFRRIVLVPTHGGKAGEWETSMLAAIHPELVHMDRAEAGYVGDLESAVQGMFEGGVKSISENGAVGDPKAASADHGRRYWEAAIELALEEIERQWGEAR